MESTYRTGTVAAASVALCLGLALTLSGSGCSSHRAPDELAQAVRMGERPVAMEGNSFYFDGALAVKVTISRGIGKGLEGGPGGGGGGGGGKGKGKGGSRPEIADVSGMDNDEAMAYIRAKSAVGSPLPPVTMRLSLHNVSKDTFSVEVTDFNSDLGNFAVRPAVLSLAPDQEAQPDPMISQLGVTSDDIPVTVTLKKAGKKESQTIHVRSLSVPPPPAK